MKNIMTDKQVTELINLISPGSIAEEELVSNWIEIDREELGEYIENGRIEIAEDHIKVGITVHDGDDDGDDGVVNWLEEIRYFSNYNEAKKAASEIGEILKAFEDKYRQMNESVGTKLAKCLNESINAGTHRDYEIIIEPTVGGYAIAISKDGKIVPGYGDIDYPATNPEEALNYSRTLIDELIDDDGQYLITDEKSYGGVDYVIVHDEINDDWGWCTSLHQPTFQEMDYPRFEWRNATRDEVMEAIKKEIDEHVALNEERSDNISSKKELVDKVVAIFEKETGLDFQYDNLDDLENGEESFLHISTKQGGNDIRLPHIKSVLKKTFGSDANIGGHTSRDGTKNFFIDISKWLDPETVPEKPMEITNEFTNEDVEKNPGKYLDLDQLEDLISGIVGFDVEFKYTTTPFKNPDRFGLSFASRDVRDEAGVFGRILEKLAIRDFGLINVTLGEDGLPRALGTVVLSYKSKSGDNNSMNLVDVKFEDGEWKVITDYSKL